MGAQPDRRQPGTMSAYLFFGFFILVCIVAVWGVHGRR
jgi:hypothetical protein